MATNNKKNELDVTYGSNLTPNTNITPTAQTMAVQAAQNNTPNIDTTYQTNSKALYGGHDASWWQNQYNNSADDNSKQMIRKAADYYGYQIPEAVSPAGAPIPANNQVAASAKNLNYASNINNVQPMAISTASNSPTTEPTQDTVSSNVDSYEEFLRKRGETIKENYEKTNESIEQQRQAATQQAEADRQRSVIDARSSYEQNKATYGTNAEALAEMGLSGSGYSDYINAQAYATQRSEVQQANSAAQSIKNTIEQQANQNKLNNDLNYQENMANNDAAIADYQLQKENQKREAYTQLLDYATNGFYSEEQLKEFGSQYGLSDDQIKNLTDTASTYKEKQQADRYRELLATIDQSGFETLKAAYDSGSINKEQYEMLTQQYQTYYYDSYTSSINTDFTAVNTTDIDNAYERGYITKAQYNKLKEKYNASLANSISAALIFYANGVQLDEKTAQAAIKELQDTGWLTDDNKNKLQDLYNKSYKDDDGGGCYAKGTLITLADGSLVPVEELTDGQELLVFNHYTGKIDTAPLMFMYHEGAKEQDILKLHFDKTYGFDPLYIDVIYGHGFFDIDLNKYVIIKPENVDEYVGHKFFNIKQENGANVCEEVVLAGYEQYRAETECYCAISEKHLNCVANGILTVADDKSRPPKNVLGFCNIFELDKDHKFDAGKMAADFDKYGVFTYDDFCEIAPNHQAISDLYFGFGGKNVKVALGKGLLSMDQIMAYIKLASEQRRDQDDSEPENNTNKE